MTRRGESRQHPNVGKEAMSDPYWYPDQDKHSTCCGAVSATEIVDGDAICSACGEHADFEEEEEE